MDHTNWLDTVMTAAVAAPSGDNLQPWRFAVDSTAQKLRMEACCARDPSPMNAGNTMARVSLGAVLMNVLLCHLANGRPLPEVNQSGGIVEIAGINGSARPGRVPEAILNRQTNRLLYYAGQVSAGEVDRLLGDYIDAFAVYCHVVGTVDSHDTTLVITQPGRIAELAEVVARADETLFTHRAARQAFLEAIRKAEADGDRPARVGLPIGTLGLGWHDRLAMRAVLRMRDTWLDLIGFARQVAARTRRLVRSADLLWFHFVRDWEPATDFMLGASAQAFWISTTLQHLACQPMMSLAVLQSMARHGFIGAAEVEPVWEMLERVLPEAKGYRVGFVFRVGAAPTPPVRTGRLPWRELLSVQELDTGAPTRATAPASIRPEVPLLSTDGHVVSVTKKGL